MDATPSRHAPAKRASPAAIARQVAALQAETLLQEILVAVPDLLLVLNPQRQVVFANHILAEHLGISEDDLVGLRPGEILGCVNAYNDSGGCGTTEACRTCGAVAAILKAVGGEDAEEEARLTLRSGDSLDLRVKTHAVRVGGDSLIVLTLRDIADEKRRRVLERVFFHDVLNTAGGVQGLAGLLRGADPEQARMITGMLETSASQLVDEIQAQRLLMAAESHDYQQDISAVSPARIVPEVVATYIPLCREAGVAIEPAPDIPLVKIETDRMMLARVLGNLVKNAVEASESGMTVRVGAERADEGVEFWVHNQTSIPRDAQLQIFQRSFSTKGPGRGLGTYSVKLFIEQYLGGSVSFETGPETGTLFRVRLPLSRD